MSKVRLIALLMVSGSYLLALGLNCIPNIGGNFLN
jgi:hypothetical protein